MSRALVPERIDAAVKYLRGRDTVLRELIDQVGPFRLELHRNRYDLLVRSILSQQISTKAAQSIRARLEGLVKPEKLKPENVTRLSIHELRGAGLSGQKAAYLGDLTKRVLDGRLRLRTIGRLADADVVATLTQVKGIGRWTAEMFLIFGLGRADVFPWDDLGIRVALRDRYGLDDLPDKATSFEIASRWRPYATVATWYCWRHNDLKRAEGNPDNRTGSRKVDIEPQGYPV